MLKLKKYQLNLLQVILHIGASLPLLFLYYKGFTDQLGASPVEEIIHFTGIGGFNLLLLSLMISPLAIKLKMGQLIRLRRPAGLYAFVYALCHFLSYLAFDLQFEWNLLFSEIIKRPYISVGFLTLILLTVLAATSTKYIQRLMGRRWQLLHNWVYLALLGVSLHYFWSVKSGIAQPLVYLALAVVLLTFRRKKLGKFLRM
ncbi:protein-methionine-sulfoxide reductase heme-binding subunit MsrQ [Paraglaciecola sp. 2405UD69-4]|uniref:protein-methionine-sulfoxide reductase heme-binding subunit MsrQ n=1 Tax=Paraglaciecola sp. 2405UD69-4 TaxID=3391836 RepID=UPI0039C95F55